MTRPHGPRSRLAVTTPASDRIPRRASAGSGTWQSDAYYGSGEATDGPLIHAPADVPSNCRWSSVGSQSLPVEEVKETRTTKSVGNSSGSRALSRHVDSN